MVGERLAELRTKKNMTQEEFADYMGVTRQSVSKWELDKAFPDVEKLIRISELYDVSIDYILKGVETTKEDQAVEEILVTEEEHCSTEIGLEEMVDGTVGNIAVKKKTGMVISLCITAALLTAMLVFIGSCLFQHNWIGDDKGIPVKVEKVYEQLSLVEVRCYDEQGEYVSETIFLDVEGVRPGDYIYAKVEGDNISVGYGGDTLILSGIFAILLIIMLVLQLKEIGKK